MTRTERPTSQATGDRPGGSGQVGRVEAGWNRQANRRLGSLEAVQASPNLLQPFLGRQWLLTSGAPEHSVFACGWQQTDGGSRPRQTGWPQAQDGGAMRLSASQAFQAPDPPAPKQQLSGRLGVFGVLCFPALFQHGLVRWQAWPWPHVLLSSFILEQGMHFSRHLPGT